jgi:hypothetical protein
MGAQTRRTGAYHDSDSHQGYRDNPTSKRKSFCSRWLGHENPPGMKPEKDET